MSASPFSSGDAGRLPPEPPHEEKSADGGLLEQVLQATLFGAGEGGSPDEPLMASLMEVARRHQGRPLSLDPVLVDLIQAIVRINLSHLAGRDADWRAMSRQIAATLWEDQPAQERLERFWTRLSEAAR
ncbi:MAG: hypothetical protein K8R36_13660 [Planctomycetales bacterium]|nr:hypothetical protein [Planctomycetales bacterium]